jgi:hypothetical protein
MQFLDSFISYKFQNDVLKRHALEGAWILGCRAAVLNAFK